jgi:hypothetical protein
MAFVNSAGLDVVTACVSVDRRSRPAHVLDVQLDVADLHEVSPRSRYRWILPVAVLGSSFTKWICLGTM